MRKIKIIFGLITLCFTLTGCANTSKIAKICEAIEDGDNKTAMELIDSTDNLNQLNVNAWELKSVLTQSDFDRSTPLVTACEKGDLEIIEYLLENGADPNFTAGDIYYPLEAMVAKNKELGYKGLELLDDYGADFSLYTHHPLLYYLGSTFKYSEGNISDGAYEMVIYLIENDKPLVNKDGFTLLHYMAQSDNTDFLEELLNCNEVQELINFMSDDGDTPLHMSALCENIDSYNLLVSYGADEYIENKDGDTPLDLLSID